MMVQWMILIILWGVFGMMTGIILSFKGHYHQKILGVTFSRFHGESEEVQGLLRRFTKNCYVLLVASVSLSLLVFLPLLRDYGEFTMLLLLTANLIANWMLIGTYQRKLSEIKRKNNWTYPRKETVNVNLSLSKESGKGCLSPVWVWLFFLISFIPIVFLLLRPEKQDMYPLWVSFVGPLCLITGVWMYYVMKKHHGIWHEEKMDEKENLIFLQKEERINTSTATFVTAAILVFWLLLNINILFLSGSFLILIAIILLMGAIIAISVGHQRKLVALENEFLGSVSKEEEPITDQPEYWKWGFYNNPSDPRLFVPKRLAGMGITINMARAGGKRFLAGILLFVALVIGIVVYAGAKDYEYKIEGDQISIDAPMYGMVMEKGEVAEITETHNLPQGVRMNGYGGINKSYGNFYLDGYGSVKLFSYNDVPLYVVIERKDGEPKYVIFNEKTKEETELLLKDVREWLGE